MKAIVVWVIRILGEGVLSEYMKDEASMEVRCVMGYGTSAFQA